MCIAIFFCYYLMLRLIDMSNENDIYFLEKNIFIYKFYFCLSYYGHLGFDTPIDR